MDREKDIFYGILLTIAIVAFIIMAFAPNDKTYYRDMVVVEANGTSLVLQSINGEIWEAEAEGYGITDTVIVELNDNATSYTIYDDKIVDIKPLIVGSY